MKPPFYSLPVLCIALLSTTARGQSHKYDTWEENYNVQGLFGAVKFEDLKFDVADSATPAEVDLSMMPQLGGAWTTRPKGDRFQYGLETSFLLGFKLDEINYLSAGGNGLYVSISSSLWLFDLAGGVYASLFVDAGKKVRIYAAGGPLMMYADYDTDKEYDDDVTEDEEYSESAFGVGVYARAGFEFRVQECGMLGLGARGTWASIDLSDAGGSSELVGVGGFVTYTAGF